MIRLLARWRGRKRDLGDERGSIALWFAITAIAAFAMLGLVVDGGAALTTRERAADLAGQAARAGAGALRPATLRGNPARLAADPAAARQAALDILDAAGATGEVSVSGDTVTVTADVAKSTVILSAVGLTDISQSATASATALYGGAQVEGGG
jgi:Flp pilus assembly protein TadG